MLNLIGSLVGPVSSILDKFIEDKDQRNKLAHEIATLAEKQAHEISLAQVDVNKEEAKSQSLFVSGWRPSVGWICSVSMGYHFVLQPFIVFIAAMYGAPIENLPEFDMSSLMTILLGMLGLGGLRTYEKHKGLTK